MRGDGREKRFGGDDGHGPVKWRGNRGGRKWEERREEGRGSGRSRGKRKGAKWVSE